MDERKGLNIPRYGEARDSWIGDIVPASAPIKDQISDILTKRASLTNEKPFFESGSRALEVSVTIPAEAGVTVALNDIRAIYSKKQGHRIQLFSAPWAEIKAVVDTQSPRKLYIVFVDTRDGAEYFVEIGLGISALSQSRRVIVQAQRNVPTNLSDEILWAIATLMA
jgi:hypothetical protein